MNAALPKEKPQYTTDSFARKLLSTLVKLAFAVVLAVAFAALPWISDEEAGVATTGLALLTSSPTGLIPDLEATRGILILIPIALILVIASVGWRTAMPHSQRWENWLFRLGSLIGLGYFALYASQDRWNAALSLIQFCESGFWIAFCAAAALFIQAFFFPADVVSTKTDADSYTMRSSPLRDLVRRIVNNPRFIQTIVFIFRFQSFFGLIIVILLAIIFSPVRNDTNLFLSQRNLSNVARDVAETGILAVGQILVIIVGGIDLSVGSIVALSATGVAFLLMRDLVPAIPAILIILGAGLLIGWWNGWTSERFKIPSFVTTLAMLSIARGLAHVWSSDIAVPISYGTGGADPLFELIGERINGVFPVPAIIMFVVALIMALILHYTAFGRHLYAIGGNQTAARLSGIAVSRVKIIAFMLSGFFAAMAGILHAAQLNQGSPNEAVGYELNAIAAVVIGGASLRGGKGTIVGVIAGAFILGILDNMLSLNNVNSNIQLMTKGLLVVAAVGLQQLRPRAVE